MKPIFGSKTKSKNSIRGDINGTSTLEEVGVKQKLDVIGRRGVGVVSVLDVQFLFFLLKKIGFAP